MPVVYPTVRAPSASMLSMLAVICAAYRPPGKRRHSNLLGLWRILCLPVSPGGFIVAKAKESAWWRHSVPTWFWVVSTLVALLLGGYVMYKAYAEDLPEIKKSLHVIQTQLGQIDGRQRELGIHFTHEQKMRARMDNSIRVLQTHMVSVVQKVEQRRLTPQEMRNIMTSVNDVSASEGRNFKAHATVVGTPPVPQMPPAVTALAEELPQGQADAFRSTTVPYKGSKESIEKLLARGFLAKNGKWEATQTGLKITYEGGTTVFAANPNLSAEDLKKKADLFNSLSQALSQTIGSREAVPVSILKNPKPEISKPPLVISK